MLCKLSVRETEMAFKQISNLSHAKEQAPYTTKLEGGLGYGIKLTILKLLPEPAILGKNMSTMHFGMILHWNVSVLFRSQPFVF